MRILLINPRYNENEYRYRVNKIPPPLGIAYIAAILLEDGYDVHILDMEGIRMEWDSLSGFVKKNSPDIIGIHGTTPIFNFISRCAAIVRESLPRSVIVIGGAHASLMPEHVLNEITSVDYLLRGEAEFTMRDLVRSIENNKNKNEINIIPGICFRNYDGSNFISSEMPKIENINKLPFPAYHLLPIDEYNRGSQLGELGASERFFTMMSSRGCPYSCIFCSESNLKGNKFRARSAENVVSEIEILNSKYGINHIIFYDSSFMIDQKRVESISKLIIQRKINITWRARVRADKINEPILTIMKESGCTTLAIGVETGSQRLLDILEKKCTIKQIEDAFDAVHKIGLWTVGYFMFGIPSETRQESMQTIEFAKRLDPDWALFTHSTPLPGTKLYEMSKHMLLTHDWSKFRFSANSPVATYGGMNEKEIKDIMDYAFYSFYVREEWLKNRLNKTRTSEQRANVINSFFYYLNKMKSSPVDNLFNW